MRLIQMHQCYLRGAETHKSHFVPESNYSGFSLHLPFSTDTETTTKAISTVMNIYKYSYECDIKVTKRLFWRKMEARIREVTREGNMEERTDKYCIFPLTCKIRYNSISTYMVWQERGDCLQRGREGEVVMRHKYELSPLEPGYFVDSA